MTPRIMLISLSMLIIVNINSVLLTNGQSLERQLRAPDTVDNVKLVIRGNDVFLRWDLLNPSGKVEKYRVHVPQDSAINDREFFHKRELHLGQKDDWHCKNMVNVTISPVKKANAVLGVNSSMSFVWQDVINNVSIVVKNGGIHTTWSMKCSTSSINVVNFNWKNNQSMAQRSIITDRSPSYLPLLQDDCATFELSIQSFNHLGFVSALEAPTAETSVNVPPNVVVNFILTINNGTIRPSWSVACRSQELKQFIVKWSEGNSGESVSATNSSRFSTAGVSNAMLKNCTDYRINIQPEDHNNRPIGIPMTMNFRTTSVSTVSLTPNVSMIHALWSGTCALTEGAQYEVTWRSEDGQHKQSCLVPPLASNSYNTNNVCNNVTLLPCTRYNVTIQPRYTDEQYFAVPVTIPSHTVPRDSNPPQAANPTPGPTSVTLTWQRPVPSCPVTYVISHNGTAMWGGNRTRVGKVWVNETMEGGRWEGGKDANVSITITRDYNTSLEKTVIDHLQPFSRYSVCVSAEYKTQTTSGHCVEFNTTEGKASIPLSLDATAVNGRQLNVTWQEPLEMNGMLTNYTVKWGDDSTLDEQWNTTTNTWYMLEGLAPCKDYNITVTAGTGGGAGEEAWTKGILGEDCTSTSTTTTDRGAEETMPTSTGSTKAPANINAAAPSTKDLTSTSSPRTRSKPTGKNTVAIVVGVLAGCSVVAAVVGAATCKRKSIVEGLGNLRRRRSAPQESYYANLQRKLEQKVNQLGNSTTLQFEFDQLAIESYDGTTDAGRRRENADKNLFRDILPFDNYRVKLARKQAGQTDYINASFVASSSVPEASFIASQGPIEGTVTDFWWMVWEQNVNTIVMLEKCSPYWPSPPTSHAHFGPFFLEVEKVVARANYVKREITLTNGEKSRNLTQFHMEEWPEFRVPRSERELLKLLKGVRQQQTKARNVLVHCSSGAGKTGTFIGLWQLTLAVEKKLSNIDVKQAVLDMRLHRPLMVQDVEQYLYLHFCFLEYLRTTNTLRELSEGQADTLPDDRDEVPQCDMVLLPAPVDDFTIWTGYVDVDDSPPSSRAPGPSGYRSQREQAQAVEMMPLGINSSTKQP